MGTLGESNQEIIQLRAVDILTEMLAAGRVNPVELVTCKHHRRLYRPIGIVSDQVRPRTAEIVGTRLPCSDQDGGGAIMRREPSETAGRSSITPRWTTPVESAGQTPPCPMLPTGGGLRTAPKQRKPLALTSGLSQLGS